MNAKIVNVIEKYSSYGKRRKFGFAIDDEGKKYYFDKYSFINFSDITCCESDIELDFEYSEDTGKQYPELRKTTVITKDVVHYYSPGFSKHILYSKDSYYQRYLKQESSENLVLDKLSELLYITKLGNISIDKDVVYQYAFVGATNVLKRYIRGQHEFLIVFSHFDSKNWQARTLKAEREIRKLREVKERNLIPNFYILVSNANELKKEIDDNVKGKPMSALIPLSFDEILSSNYSSLRKLLLSRFEEYYFEYNILDESSAIEEDRLLFGERGKIADGIAERCMNDGNCGIFGLRRSGKTSVLKATLRRFDLHNIKYVSIESRSVLAPASSWQYALFCIAKRIQETVLGIFQKSDESLADYSERLHLNRTEDDYQANGVLSFVEDVQLYCRNIEHFVIAIDEIELITYNTATSDTWKNLDAYCNFWSALRDCGCSLILCGVNSTINELSTIYFNGVERDNPMYERIAYCSDSFKTYLPPFTNEQTKHMINTLGSFSNIGFSNVYSLINSVFGGQPYAIRQFCAYVYEEVKDQRQNDAVYEVTRATIDNLLIHFHQSSKGLSLYGTILQHVQTYYKQEHNLLKRLAYKNDSEIMFEPSELQSLDHLIKYGLIEYDYGTHFATFRIEAIRNYICSIFEKQPEDMTNDERRRYIQDNIVKIEKILKKHIKQYCEATGDESLFRTAVNNLRHNDSIDKFTCDFDDLFDHKKVLLYFSNLRKIISDNWSTLGRRIDTRGITKPKFNNYMIDLNAGRTDADHYDPEDEDNPAVEWDISDDILLKFKVAFNELHGVFE